MALLALFYLLAGTYSVMIPIWEATDEPGQFQFVRHLAEGKGLPVQSPRQEENAVDYGHHPPLYFALGGLVLSRADFSGLEDLRPNPSFDWMSPFSGPNLYAHTEAENFPWRGGLLAVHVLRLVSVALMGLTVLGTYLLALELFPQHRLLALGAAAFNAFLPQFLFQSAVINNDALLVPLATAVVLLTVKVLKGTPHKKHLVLLGVLLGLLALTKLSGLLLFPWVLVALAAKALLERSFLALVRYSLWAFATAAVIAGWWYGRNWLLYGDPLAWNLWKATRPTLMQGGPYTWERFVTIWEPFHESFWASFGWRTVMLEPGYYLLFLLFFLVSAGGLALLGWRYGGKLRQEHLVRTNLLLLGIVVLFFVAGMVRFAATFGHSGTMGRYVFPAIAAISLFMVLGLAAWTVRLLHVLPLAVFSFLVAFSAYAPFGIIAPTYARPQPVDPTELEGMAQQPRVNFGNQIELVAYQVAKTKVQPGQEVWVTLYWRALAPLDKDYLVFLHLVGKDDRNYHKSGDAYPFKGVYLTSFWRPGDLLRDRMRLIVGADAPPARYRLALGLYREETAQRLPILDESGMKVDDRFFLATIKIPLQGNFKPAVALAEPVVFGGSAALAGYDLPKGNLTPGGTLPLTLYWKAMRPLDRDYTVFVHLVDAAGKLWTQHDGQPRSATYPTSLWEPGETIPDEHLFTLPPHLPPGRYQLRVGLYLLESGERLALAGGDPAQNFFTLGTVAVGAP